MLVKYIPCLTFLMVMSSVCCIPLNHDIDRTALAAVSDLNSAVSGLNSRVASRGSLLPSDRDQRLSLPSSQDLETIKKVAQILIMLGEQILPPTFGERPSRPPPSACESSPQDIPTSTAKDK